MSDENTTLLGGEVRITTIVQEQPQAEQQPGQARDDHSLRDATYLLFMSISSSLFGIHLIWMICFFVVFASTNPANCTGALYTFGNVARWFLLAFVIWDTISIFVMKWWKNQPDPAYASPPACYRFVSGIYMAALIGFWIYAIAALFERDGCTGQTLTSALWVWVIMYAILPCCICCFLCCGGCIMVGGAFLASKV